MYTQDRNIALVRKAKKGNEGAFSTLILQYSNDAYRIAYSYLQNEADSKDALAAGIEKAFYHLKELNKETHFRGWFIKIVVNEALMLMRKSMKNNYLPIEDFEQGLQAPITLNVEENMDLSHALSLLSPADRGLIMGKYYLEYTFKELSELYRLPESTVKSRIYRLLEQMKINLQESEGNYEQNSL